MLEKERISAETAEPASAAAPATMLSGKLGRIRRRVGAVLFLAAMVIQQTAWHWLAEDRTRQVMVAIMIVAFALLVLVLWWMFFPGATWRARFQGAAAVAVAIGIWIGLFRLDGFSGEVLPQFSMRWNPAAGRPARALANPPAAVAKHQPGGAAEVRRPPLVEPGDWPEFRGSKRDGVVTDLQLSKNESDYPPRLMWRRPVGAGWSSFAVVGPWALTQEQRADDEAVVCYELETGREIWVHTDRGRFVREPSGEGPRGTPTVVANGVLTVGATGLLNCLDLATGAVRWSHEILTENSAQNKEWGTSSSPLAFEDLVVVNPGGPNGHGVVAYDLKTGEKRWSAGNDKSGYASPQLAKIGGVEQILVFDAAGLAGHDQHRGTELWKFPWKNGPQISVAQPIVLSDHEVFVGNGYGHGCTVVEVLADGKAWTATALLPASTAKNLKLKFNGAVARDGFVYGLDEGILTCFDLKTGERRWKRGRYGYGQLLLVDDVVLVQAESGEVVLVQASPEDETVLARFQALDDKTWNQPVICHGKLLVRNATEAACYDMAPKALANVRPERRHGSD